MVVAELYGRKLCTGKIIWQNLVSYLIRKAVGYTP
jgi:hypothetical protein